MRITARHLTVRSLTFAIIALAVVSIFAMIVSGAPASGQRDNGFNDPTAARAVMERAIMNGREAAERGERLEAEARAASQAGDRAAKEAAALAARIQQTEADITVAQTRLALVNARRSALDRKLGRKREPIVRLTGALQNMARRPLVLSALKPGSLRETVYLRAVLEGTVPQIRNRTAVLRAEILQGRALQREAAEALAALQSGEAALETKRSQLAAMETRQRLASRRASGGAAREKERALALAEEARDLDSFIAELDKAGTLRAELAALPGPIMRPANGTVAARPAAPVPRRSRGDPNFRLPVSGRIVAGFDAIQPSGVRNGGITLASVANAQIIVPAAGRVAFSGPYRGYDRIVIVEHAGGWTSLVTGLARTDAKVGETLVAGAPIGIAGSDNPRVSLELRRDGTRVNPLDHLQ